MGAGVLPVEERLLEVKAALVETWAPGGDPIGLLEKVLDYEPTKAPKLPLLTMMTRGFQRANLEGNEIRRPVVDPIGGRAWIWELWVRVWVGFKTDAKVAQRSLDVLIPQVVVALEADATLGGVAEDSALEAGQAAIVRPTDGNPVLMLTSTLLVETVEPLT
jgi:hypothetical protein